MLISFLSTAREEKWDCKKFWITHTQTEIQVFLFFCWKAYSLSKDVTCTWALLLWQSFSMNTLWSISKNNFVGLIHRSWATYIYVNYHLMIFSVEQCATQHWKQLNRTGAKLAFGRGIGRESGGKWGKLGQKRRKKACDYSRHITEVTYWKK